MFPADSMKQLQGRDGNISALLDTREQYQDRNLKRTIQMHSSLVQRLDLETVMEGHQGCVNALSWNSRGSLLLSGSDDTRVNVWDYSSRKLLHSVESGHSTNIFCVKFLPESDDEIVASGAGDAEVRVHRLSRAVGGGYGTSRQMLVNNCHVRRVKKLAVEEGNPHVVWSASEDGTLRQHDLREDVPCPDDFNHDCRKVLLDLRNASKKSLSDPPRSCLGLKTCAINAVRPHQLLVGGSDAFARLYDRRKLPPPSLSRGQTKTPDCVCYYCPTHLSDLNRSSSLHLTHVAFSPDGQEVLLSYSGEHVYLMDVNTGKDNNSIAYEAADVPKRLILAPIINDANIGIRKENSISKSIPNSIKFARMETYGQLLCGAKNALRDRKNSHYVVEMASEVLDVRDPLIVPKVQHDFLCIRAEAFLKRLWKNDIHMAIRDCIEARAIDSRSVLAHSIMSDALFELQKHKEALDFAVRAHSLDPSNTGLSEKVKYLQSKLDTAEEAKNKRNVDDGDKNVDKKALNMAYIGDFLFRSESDQFDLSPESRQSEMEDSDVDDVEMEMEIEMSLPVDGEIGQESGSRSGSSLNLRLRRRRDQSAEHQTRDQASSSDRSIDDALIKTEVAYDMKQRYVGHCNVGTDIKQASFLGEKGEYVASGSDDGRWFIWQKKTGRLIKILKGDKNVVNCVQCHPFDAAIATSGIDNTIKMWSPVASVASLVSGGEDGPESSDVLSIMAENQQKMQRRQGFGLPQLFQRFTIPEVGIRPFECTQS